jgi:Ni/Fe-hydrogenase b-type cytochrome subunit
MAGPREQPWVIRSTHWVAAVSLALMAGSGLQIYSAYPYQGARGATYEWFPLQGENPPGWLRIGGGLAGARHWHFAFAWVVMVNALAYLAFILASGEWRRRLFVPRRDAKSAIRTALAYLRVGPHPAQDGLYNGLQRAAYTGAFALGALQVLTGVAIWKPVQLPWLVAACGGYDLARAIHFIGLALLVLFVFGHVIMVAAHPRTFPTMLTGGRRG